MPKTPSRHRRGAPVPPFRHPPAALVERPSSTSLLDRLLDTPQLARVVRQLPADVLHRVVQHCGLEACGELLILATPRQLTAVCDLDLWRARQPGLDEAFDAERFGLWLEVLVECGASAAAHTVAQMDPDLVVFGMAQHVRVSDQAAGIPIGDDGPSCGVADYLVAARRTDAWDAVITLLSALESKHSAFFHRVMRGCRALSDSAPEIDGLDDLLERPEQAMFDLAVGREQRRDAQGYITPVQAAAFLQMARTLDLRQPAPPPPNPLVRAYFQAMPPEGDPAGMADASASVNDDPVPDDIAGEVSAVADVLRDAGVLPDTKRPLLTGSQAPVSRVPLLDAQLLRLQEVAESTSAMRHAELAYLVNTLMAGCALQRRPFELPEATEAVAAVCNLGLEHWPPQWCSTKPDDPSTATPRDLLVHHDLVTVFQVGWAVLYREVCMFTAGRLLAAVDALRSIETAAQEDLDLLYVEMSRQWRAGTPWRATDRLEVIQMLDLPAWAALAGLIAELPVLHAGVGASVTRGVRSVDPAKFAFISQGDDLAAVHAFAAALPETLRT